MDGEGAGKAPRHALDAMAVAPGHHAILVHNDQVRVLDARLGPGQRTPVHAHEWPPALYVLSWSDFVRYDLDGAVLVDSRQAMPDPPAPGFAGGPRRSVWRHVRTVGDRDVHIIAVEVKGP